MITLSHPVGNQNVRQALAALKAAEMLDRFHTTVFWDPGCALNSLLPHSLKSELCRRSYPQVPRSQISSTTPLREAGRLLAGKLGLDLAPNSFSVRSVCDRFDQAVARYVERRKPQAVYAYTGIALETFRSAKRNGTVCIYEVLSGYWHYDAKLLQEEALLRPDYAGTIQTVYHTPAFLAARDEELSLADHIIIPSSHVKHTLESSPIRSQDLHIIPYGTSEASSPVRTMGRSNSGKLRVLYVGQLTQRKGISYLFDAIKMIGRDVELTIIGKRIGNSTAVDATLKEHRWIPSVPNQQILEEMTQHDVLVLPSLSEGFALVIGEALSRGLPVITTTSSGAAEIIRNGQDGFFVPIRSAEAIAEKLEILNKDRNLLEAMSASALKRARELTWQSYRSLLISTLKGILEL